MVQSKKLFTAELQLQKRLAEFGGQPPVQQVAPAPAGIAPNPVPVAADNFEVLSRLDLIERKLDQVLTVDHEAIDRIHVEIADISGRIKATKVEIAALRHPLSDEDKFLEASEQLTAVVSATESATDTIMSAAEGLEEILQEVRSQMPDGYQSSRLNDMNDLIIRIFEACNFQDLTGQRITKVVRTLSFIEERINAMMDLWNRREFEALPLPPPVAAKDGDLILHGPADLPHEKPISQADIDALFG